MFVIMGFILSPDLCGSHSSWMHKKVTLLWRANSENPPTIIVLIKSSITIQVMLISFPAVVSFWVGRCFVAFIHSENRTVLQYVQ